MQGAKVITTTQMTFKEIQDKKSEARNSEEFQIAGIIKPRHEKTCLCHMQAIKVQISLRIAQSDQRLCCSLPR